MSNETENDRERGGLKLAARDVEDMDILGSLLQDALVPLCDVTFLKDDAQFVLVANRFCWDTPSAMDPSLPSHPAEEDEATGEEDGDEDAVFHAPGNEPLFYRVNCGICFDRVKAVQYRSIDPTHRDEILNLLTVAATPTSIKLLFSGGGAIRLEVESIRCHMKDLGEPWPTRYRPEHAETTS